MNDRQILGKAIEQSIKGGWKSPYSHCKWEVTNDGGNHYKIECLFNGQLFRDDYQRIIFNHDFARALWGEYSDSDKEELMKHFPNGLAGGDFFDPWKHHLQQMVIADDPIQYLGEHL